VSDTTKHYFYQTNPVFAHFTIPGSFVGIQHQLKTVEKKQYIGTRKVIRNTLLYIYSIIVTAVK
jgi:hypothetical protein